MCCNTRKNMFNYRKEDQANLFSLIMQFNLFFFITNTTVSGKTFFATLFYWSSFLSFHSQYPLLEGGVWGIYKIIYLKITSELKRFGHGTLFQ